MAQPAQVTRLPADLLESSPVAPALHAELTSILEAHPTVAKQLSRTASAGAPLLRKLPISEFLVAAYGEPAINTGTCDPTQHASVCCAPALGVPLI
jgi:hypothetical protein